MRIEKVPRLPSNGQPIKIVGVPTQ